MMHYTPGGVFPDNAADEHDQMLSQYTIEDQYDALDNHNIYKQSAEQLAEDLDEARKSIFRSLTVFEER